MKSSVSTRSATSRRKLSRTRDLWLEFYRDAYNALLGDERERKLTADDAAELVEMAECLADKALGRFEERFPGL